MPTTDIRLVVVEKDSDLRTHVGRARMVTWTDGRETKETLPACGTKVDVAALYPYTGSVTEVTCRRCEKTGLYANAAR